MSLILSHTCDKDPSETNHSHRPTFQWENELGDNHEVSQQNTNRAVQTYQRWPQACGSFIPSCTLCKSSYLPMTSPRCY